jgi:hypothetical protein
MLDDLRRKLGQELSQKRETLRAECSRPLTFKVADCVAHCCDRGVVTFGDMDSLAATVVDPRLFGAPWMGPKPTSKAAVSGQSVGWAV